MSCPFVGLATRYTTAGERVTVRICGALPYERDDDPQELPPPTVCFSVADWQQCYHYITMSKRKEIAHRLAEGGPVWLDEPAPDEHAPDPTLDERDIVS